MQISRESVPEKKAKEPVWLRAVSGRQPDEGGSQDQTRFQGAS